jgi:dTDP-4-amino-4,6-dideoxygalactose transaminase
MDPIMELARKRGLKVIEDACQAHGAEYKGRRAGSIGDAGCFSFYPGKNLGAFGEAGAVVTNDGALAETMRVLRDHGQSRKYVHKLIGWNARMDGIQGAVLKVKLRHLDTSNERRRAHARRYVELFKNVPGFGLPAVADYGTHVYHIFAIRLKERDAFIAGMTEKGIGCAIHYPVPLHLQEAYAGLGLGPGAFPVSERCQSEFVSLPMFPDLTQDQIEAVVCQAVEIRK